MKHNYLQLPWNTPGLPDLQLFSPGMEGAYQILLKIKTKLETIGQLIVYLWMQLEFLHLPGILNVQPHACVCSCLQLNSCLWLCVVFAISRVLFPPWYNKGRWFLCIHTWNQQPLGKNWCYRKSKDSSSNKSCMGSRQTLRNVLEVLFARLFSSTLSTQFCIDIIGRTLGHIKYG